ncbi:hypothetical protein A3H75_02105 [Candidatus Uhrbacteria bacterium RIFCSPLOWO2_02_FULL_51_9]|uniref:Arabinofuranosyltransferase AftA N-terminal domain-containing protein n=1 Tax=Candidatus Uhrbacteria bacterium RIFCSPLOWO2_02_FULL_51_9 TaxID=1802410 RepID=A0A1F7VFW2_9BACT|nr:MAG: hypothetical protein A3H75_02105 [Candidatus Uhrbacteria bacterium RIFCSPLOWO2_02_FULL_51_9]
MLTLPDLAPFAINGLLLLGTTLAGLVVILRRPRPLALTVLLATAMGGGFALLMNNRGLPWWGLQGDEAFIGAAITKAWHSIFWSDFYYTGLPPFYPPLYFWITGALGHLFGLPPIVAMNAGVAVSLFLLPLTIYAGVQSLPTHLFPSLHFKKWFAFFAAGSLFLVSEWTSFLSKPFEFLTAAVAIIFVLHTVTLARGAHHRPVAATIILGIVGALIIWTYYLWIIFIVLALAIAGISYASENRARWYGTLTRIFAISAILSAPFWITLLRTTFAGGESWQTHWFTLEEFTIAPTLISGGAALVALIGIGSAITFRKHIIPFTLGAIVMAPVLWFAMNMGLLATKASAIMPTKAMHFLGAYALAILAAWTTTHLWLTIKNTRTAQGFLVAVWILFVLMVPSGIFTYQFGAQHILNLKQPREIAETVKFLTQHPVRGTALVSEQPLIVGQAPLNLFISFNMHFTHPKAMWSLRHLIVQDLTRAKTPEAFTKIVRDNQIAPIDLLILRKYQDTYQLFFWVDRFPNGGAEETLAFPQKLVSTKSWKKLFENNGVAVWQFNETADADE